MIKLHFTVFLNKCSCFSFLLTLKQLGVNLTPPPLPKMYLPKTGWKPWFFLTFSIIIKHIFPEDFIEIRQFVQKIWIISLSILANFINFLDFLTFPCYKETNDVGLYQMMSAFFHFQHTSDRLFNNCIKLCWY